jgi:hypothetical protein
MLTIVNRSKVVRREGCSWGREQPNLEWRVLGWMVGRNRLPGYRPSRYYLVCGIGS